MSQNHIGISKKSICVGSSRVGGSIGSTLCHTCCYQNLCSGTCLEVSTCKLWIDDTL
jgi:hypothetical protein